MLLLMLLTLLYVDEDTRLLLLRNGKAVETPNGYEIKGEMVLFTNKDGSVIQLPTRVVDFDKTKAYQLRQKQEQEQKRLAEVERQRKNLAAAGTATDELYELVDHVGKDGISDRGYDLDVNPPTPLQMGLLGLIGKSAAFDVSMWQARMDAEGNVPRLDKTAMYGVWRGGKASFYFRDTLVGIQIKEGEKTSRFQANYQLQGRRIIMFKAKQAGDRFSQALPADGDMMGTIYMLDPTKMQILLGDKLVTLVR